MALTAQNHIKFWVKTENHDAIILELWSRSFTLCKGGKTRPEQADQFLVFARVPEVTLDKVIAHSVPGVYTEPRLDGDKGHHPSYRVVWLQRADHSEALHQCRTCPFSMGLVRLKDRYGLRVRQKDEAAVWKLLRPDDEYKDVQVKDVYELTPFEHGTTKSMVEQVLQAWGWKAKVLQPGRGSGGYMSWKVGTSEQPRSYVYACDGLDIIANLVKQVPTAKKHQTTIATWKTKNHIWKGGQNEASTSSTDPWMEQKDPWAAYKAKGAGQQSERTYLSEVSNVLQKQIEEQVQKQCAQIREQVDQQMVDVGPEDESEVQALRNAVYELQAQNGACQQWMQEATSKIQSVEQSSQETQRVVQSQQQEIQTLRNEIQQNAVNSGNMMQQALSTVKRELVAELAEANSKHFSQLEALMSKKLRQE